MSRRLAEILDLDEKRVEEMSAKIISGSVYDLEHLISIDGYHGFIMEEGETFGHDSKGENRVDLGKGRILKFCPETNIYLILANKSEIIPVLLPSSGCRVSDILKEKGIKYSIVAEYGGRMGKDGKRYGFIWETWKMALHERRGLFSGNGYALQYKGWADYWFYQFEMNLVTKGQVVLDGHDIEKFSVWNDTNDIMDKALFLIMPALTEKVNISGKKFAELLKSAGLGDSIEWIRMYEREEEKPSK